MRKVLLKERSQYREMQMLEQTLGKVPAAAAVTVTAGKRKTGEETESPGLSSCNTEASV